MAEDRVCRLHLHTSYQLLRENRNGTLSTYVRKIFKLQNQSYDAYVHNKVKQWDNHITQTTEMTIS